MALAAGFRLGPYEIHSALGAGGMGEVYRATDTNLKRQVAIKVLPESVAADPERLARFQREAEILAALNHPHIAAIHGLEKSGGTTALVMELVEGPTLADRIAQGAIPLDEALPIAKQIAEALEAAHERGIIHRDLKPANIKLRVDGTVKVLDFGLAKALGPAEAGHYGSHTDGRPVGLQADLSQSPTITSPAATLQGVILGTAAYMSPEQARGKPVDKRCDIWAFGCVLYEMVTGRTAFQRQTVTDTLSAVVDREPDWTAIPASVPTNVTRLLQRCLRKDPARRLHDIADARLEIEEAGSEPHPTASRPPARERRTMAWAVGGLVTGGLLAALGIWSAGPTGEDEPRPLRQFTVAPAASLERYTGVLLTLSQDGNTLVYAGVRDGVRRLYRRSMGQQEDTLIPGAEGRAIPVGVKDSGPACPFFSPDGEWIAFTKSRALVKMPLAGGAAITLTEELAGACRGATWGDDDTIILGTDGAGLLRFSANGGAPSAVLTPKDGEGAFIYPQFLPDERVVVFTVAPDLASGHLELLSLETGERRRLLPGVAGRVVRSGHLVFFREGALWAVGFDQRRREIVGEPVRVVERVHSDLGVGPQFATADDGSLVYIPDRGSDAAADRTLVWVDQAGHEEPIQAPALDYRMVRVSPDGRRVAAQVGDGRNADIWAGELDRGALSRLTDDASSDVHPLWTPDGQRIVFGSDREGSGRNGLVSIEVDGSGAIEHLVTVPDAVMVQPHAWSLDGSRLIIFQIPQARVSLVRMDGGRQLEAFPRPTPSISPDGEWMAYTSTETGAPEVYVERFPALSQKTRVSIRGGGDPIWSPDGTRLYYLRSPPTAMMVVPIDTSPALTVGTPRVVFERQYYRQVPGTRTHSIASDGSRFLMIKTIAGTTKADEIRVVLNWSDELRRLLPTDQ